MKGRISSPKSRKRQYRQLIYPGVAVGIVLSSLTLTVSLFTYYQPTAMEKAILGVKELSARIFDAEEVWANPIEEELTADAVELPSSEVSDSLLTNTAASEESEGIKETDETSAEAVESGEDTTYTVMLNTAMGPMLYYNQSDSRWADYLYGGQDPLKKYGCGPTAVAMLLNSFSSSPITPPEAADWSVANGCYAAQSGSYHQLIKNSLSAGGLQVQSIKKRTADTAAELLRTGHILIALMGEGIFTDNGHFILITELLDDGTVHIADPNSYENSTKEWNLDQLIDELKEVYDSGAPLWAVSFPTEG